MSNIGTAIQGAHAAILTASGQSVWIINRTYSGVATAANYMEQPTLTQTSGAVTAKVTNPSQRDMMAEPGHYLQDDRIFHIASGTVVNQFDYLKLAGTGDAYVITEIPTHYVSGVQVFEKLVGRRIKVN